MRHFRVWYDEYILRVGDSFRTSIDKGLRECNYGIVVLSEHFFEKNWPQAELNALFALMMNDTGKRLLPVIHKISFSRVQELSPLLSDFYAVSSSAGLDVVVKHLNASMLRDEEKQRYDGKTTYIHAYYDHNYYNPASDVPSMGYRFDSSYDFDKMVTALRLREILMCFLRDPGLGGWDSTCHITCKERMRDMQVDADAEYYAVDIDKLHNENFDHPLTSDQLRRIRRDT